MRIVAVLTTSLFLVAFGMWFVSENRMQIRNFGRRYIQAESPRISAQEKLRLPYEYEHPQKSPDWESIDATSVLVLNPVTNQVFYSRNIDEERSIASITKLMTALVALDVYKTTDLIKVTKDIEIQDRRVDISLGDTATVRELMEAMLISSKNDVAHILANEYEGGYEDFIRLMNQKAKDIGMTSTKFSSPSGYFDDGNYSTAFDLMILARAAISKDEILDIVSKSREQFEFSSNGVVKSESLSATNELLWRSSNTVGLKTGHTLKSGPSYIGHFKSSPTDQIIVILLNAPDRFEQALNILKIVQQNYSIKSPH